MIKKLCEIKSIPEDYHQTLDQYARNGYRVLALATKAFQKGEMDFTKAYQITREEAESELTFLGFLIF